MAKDPSAYEFPEPYDPGAFKCVQVYIPDHAYYHAAFWASYEFLARWNAWKRDDAHTAKEVAAIWRVGFEIARAQWVASGGEGSCEMPYQLRDDPDDPCAVQQSLDDGETWIHAFNKEDCGGSVVTPPPYPDDGSPARTAAGNAIDNIYNGLLNLNPDCAMSRAEFIAAGTNYLRLFDPTYSNPMGLGAVYDAFCALSPEEKEEALSQCPYKDRMEDIVDCYDGGGVLNDLQCLAEKIGSWLDTAASELGLSLDVVAGALGFPGWQAASGGGGGGGGGSGFGGGYGAECGDWEYTFDFTVSDGDGVGNTHMNDILCEYESGVGWKSTGTSSPFWLRCEMNTGFMTVTFMEIDYTTDAVHSNSEKCQLTVQSGIWAGGPDSDWGTGGEEKIHDTHLEAGHAPSVTAEIGVFMHAWNNYPFEPIDEVQVTLTRWRIVGVGVNPFA